MPVNATANVPGTFIFARAARRDLVNQTLSVDFQPDDDDNYEPACEGEDRSTG
jgi:hypothetical protein